MQQQQMQPLPFAAGEVAAVEDGWVVVTAGTEQWSLQVEPGAPIKVNGKAKADFVTRGYCIAFTATVDAKHSKVTDEKISKFTLCSPDDEQRPIGAVPQGSGGAFGPKAKGDAGGLGSAFGGDAFGGALQGGGSAAPSAGRKTGGAAKKGAAATPEAFDICGKITSVKNGELTLRVPNKHFKPILKIELDEDADIDVALTGPDAILVVKKGDKIDAIKGKRQGNTRLGLLSDATITLGAPLTGAPAKKKASSKSEHGAKGRHARDADASGDDSATDTPKPSKKSKKKAAAEEDTAPSADEK